MTQHNITTAFKYTGIYPFNKAIIIDDSSSLGSSTIATPLFPTSTVVTPPILGAANTAISPVLGKSTATPPLLDTPTVATTAALPLLSTATITMPIVDTPTAVTTATLPLQGAATSVTPILDTPIAANTAQPSFVDTTIMATTHIMDTPTATTIPLLGIPTTSTAAAPSILEAPSVAAPFLLNTPCITTAMTPILNVPTASVPNTLPIEVVDEYGSTIFDVYVEPYDDTMDILTTEEETQTAAQILEEINSGFIMVDPLMLSEQCVKSELDDIFNVTRNVVDHPTDLSKCSATRLTDESNIAERKREDDMRQKKHKEKEERKIVREVKLQETQEQKKMKATLKAKKQEQKTLHDIQKICSICMKPNNKRRNLLHVHSAMNLCMWTVSRIMSTKQLLPFPVFHFSVTNTCLPIS